MQSKLLILSSSLVLLASTAEAQRLESSAFKPAKARAVAEQQRSSGANPSVTLMGGIATGEGSLDMGVFFSTSWGWRLSGTSLVFRFDPSLGYYTGGNSRVDISQLLLGFPAALEYEFNTVGFPKPYINGGVGIYYTRVSVDDDDVLPIDDVSASETDLGLNIGGGLRFTNKIGLEVRLIDVSGFTTIPIMLTYRVK